MKLCIAFIICLFISISVGVTSSRNIKSIEIVYYLLPKSINNTIIKIEDTTRLQYLTVNEFLYELGWHESKNNYLAVNKFGFRGRYQFSRYMINRFANTTPTIFLKNPQIQEIAMKQTILYYIEYVKTHDLLKYVGKEIKGVTITLEGLILGMHFCPVYLKKWLESDGEINNSDGYITIRDYIEKFEKEGVVRQEYRILYY